MAGIFFMRHGCNNWRVTGMQSALAIGRLNMYNNMGKDGESDGQTAETADL